MELKKDFSLKNTDYLDVDYRLLTFAEKSNWLKCKDLKKFGGLTKQ